MMGYVTNQRFKRWKRNHRILGASATFLFCMCLFFFTPTIPRSPNQHQFADVRNLLGVPNTLNVMTNFPFLVVGVLGFVFALDGSFFNISSQGEMWGWVAFYSGIIGVAFGSAYYHLKPDNHRVLWDTLPMMVAFSSLMSCLIFERFGQRIGSCCMSALLVSAILCVLHERIYNDIRFCLMFQLILPLAIPAVAFMYRSKYTYSGYWFLSTVSFGIITLCHRDFGKYYILELQQNHGASAILPNSTNPRIYLLAKFEGVTDRKLCRVSTYFITGHSLEHLCLALIPISLSIMLIYREPKFQRLVNLKDRP